MRTFNELVTTIPYSNPLNPPITVVEPVISRTVNITYIALD